MSWSWSCMEESCHLWSIFRAFIVMMLPLEYYLAINTPLLFACYPLCRCRLLWHYAHAFIWVPRIFVSMRAWYGPKLPHLFICLTWLIGTLVGASQALWPLIVKLDFMRAHPMFLHKGSCLLFILGPYFLGFAPLAH